MEEKKIVDTNSCVTDEDYDDEFFEFAEYTAYSFVEMWNAKYGGSFVDANGNAVFIKKVVYDDPEVVILWNDGTKSTAHCAKEDKYNFEMGLLVAVCEKVFGKKRTDALFDDWLPDTDSKDRQVVTIADVRKKHKCLEKLDKLADKAMKLLETTQYLESCGYKVEAR